VQFCDVIFCNRYYAWYHDFGQTQLISHQVERELRDWFDTYAKPVVQAEYGADTVAGMHVVRAYKFDVMSLHMEKIYYWVDERVLLACSSDFWLAFAFDFFLTAWNFFSRRNEDCFC